jgi:hypothetical protein
MPLALIMNKTSAMIGAAAAILVIFMGLRHRLR